MKSEPKYKPPTVGQIVSDPHTRNYLVGGLVALAVIFLVMYVQESILGGILVIILGVAGLLLRWTAVPPFLLMLLTYFLLFPIGRPPAYENPWELTTGSFRIADMLLTFAVVIYLACQYRILGLVHRAFPSEYRSPREIARAYRRPGSAVATGELGQLLYLAAGMVLIGQISWWLLTNVEVDLSSTFPLHLAESKRNMRRSAPPNGMSLAGMRFVLLMGITFFGATIVRTTFGYWRMRRYRGLEAQLVLLDADWDETRRERDRIEGWGGWLRKREAEKNSKQPRKIRDG